MSATVGAAGVSAIATLAITTESRAAVAATLEIRQLVRIVRSTSLQEYVHSFTTAERAGRKAGHQTA